MFRDVSPCGGGHRKYLHVYLSKGILDLITVQVPRPDMEYSLDEDIEMSIIRYDGNVRLYLVSRVKSVLRPGLDSSRKQSSGEVSLFIKYQTHWL